MRTYSNQFTINDEQPITVPIFLLIDNEWQDMSWGNEACPRWINEKLGLSIWVDYDNAEQREVEESNKFTVTDINDNLLIETDNENKLLKYIAKYELIIKADSITNKLQDILMSAKTYDLELTANYAEAALDEVASLKATLQ